MINILHFLLENTVFQNVLQDLRLNVLYIEEGCKHQHAIESVHPKCMFIASSFAEGERLFERVQPQVVIIYVSDSIQVEHIKRIYDSQIAFIVIWDQPVTAKFVDMLKIGIRNMVLPQ